MQDIEKSVYEHWQGTHSTPALFKTWKIVDMKKSRSGIVVEREPRGKREAPSFPAMPGTPVGAGSLGGLSFGWWRGGRPQRAPGCTRGRPVYRRAGSTAVLWPVPPPGQTVSAPGSPRAKLGGEEDSVRKGHGSRKCRFRDSDGT